jgi:choloylglycine hydrolase
MSLNTRVIYSLAVGTAFFLSTTSIQACTDFKLTAADGTYLITRSMEFAQDLKSNLRSSPRGRLVTTMTPDNKPGLSWKGKYGYISVDGFGIDASFDGMNETGLTFEYLYLPGETGYQTIPAGKEDHAIPYTQFGDWVLANFKSIDEVKEALNTVYVTTQSLPQLGDAVLPAHASIYDASGKGIVVEFYNNKINVYDNIGVMTNSPKYDWHVTNLRNYINLSPVNPSPIVQNGLTFSSLGQGTGAVGLPGDASPPSRFVKIAFMVKNVDKAQNKDDLINLAEHIINNVDIPSGYVRAVSEGKTDTDITQWVVFKDITHKKFYYRTYNDMTLRGVELDKVNLSENAPRLKMPFAGSPYSIDVTGRFLKSAQ